MEPVRRYAAIYQFSQAFEQFWIVDHVEKPAPTVLAARALWSRASALLVHVAEN
jgi:hypothetical protein